MPKTYRVVTVLLVAVLAIAAPPASSRAAAADGPADYYYNAGRRVSLMRSTTRVAMVVRDAAARGRTLEGARALGAVRGVRDVKAGAVVEVTIDDARVVPPELGAVARSAGGAVLPVFYEPGAERDESTLFVTDEILVQFKPEVSPAEVAAFNARHGADALEPLRYAPNGFRLRVSSPDAGRNALTVANAYYESGLCLWAHPNFLAHRSLRYVPDDPRYPNQWHLNNTGQGGGQVGADVKAQAAWDVTLGSSSISVAVADTGIDQLHEEFNVMVGGVPKVHDPRDVVHADDDPYPGNQDANTTHGTSASGVAIAADNTVGGMGIAPGCRFVPIQLYAESTFTPNATEADAFTWAADHADVMSNSWGPDNPGTPLPDATRMAMDYCNTNGRGGKGTVIFFAAGNSNFDIDFNNNDSYSSYPGVVAVAASTNQGVKSGYSSFGQSISVTAPSDGGSRGINTTNFSFSNHNSYTSFFGGTSSACPLAAGVGALVLSVNPNLTWREAKSVLEQSADKIDVGSTFGQYDALGHSIYYGYGRVNAQRAVALAVAGGPDTAGIYAAGAFFLRDSNSPGLANATFTFGSGAPGLKPLAGDWNGDGTSTAGVYDPATATFFLRNSNTPGTAELAFSFGPLGAVPLAGDWDGDGISTVGVYVPATGAFFLKNTNGPGMADITFTFGAAPSSLVPIAGDWDNDVDDTVGLYDPVTGNFFLKNSNSGGAADIVFGFGAGGATPLAGDWNGDGADSIGIYDTATGAFFVKNVNGPGAADWVYTFGAGGATPLAGNWDGF